MAVVSNASPLITLSKLGQLNLLPELYDRVLIPQAVYEEVVVAGLRAGHVDAIAVDHFVRAGRIVVQPVEVSVEDDEWSSKIDDGEAEVIVLAREISADWAIIDNAHARRAARTIGVRPRGTVGVLLEALSRGRIRFLEFELLIDEIKRRPEFWISERLCDAALDKARGEHRLGTNEG